MAAHDYITVTDYSATEPYEDPARFSVEPGNIEDIKNASCEGEAFVNKIAMVFDRYMRWRFSHAIVLTTPDYEIFRKFHTKELEACMVNLLDHYTLDHDVFMLNLIPHQSYLLDPDEINPDRIGNLFKRWDFIDIGGSFRKLHKVELNGKLDYLEVKSMPDPESETLEYLSDRQLVELKHNSEIIIFSQGDIKDEYCELLNGGYVLKKYLIPYNINIAKYAHIRCNGIGHAGITGNFEFLW